MVIYKNSHFLPLLFFSFTSFFISLLFSSLANLVRLLLILITLDRFLSGKNNIFMPSRFYLIHSFTHSPTHSLGHVERIIYWKEWNSKIDEILIFFCISSPMPFSCFFFDRKSNENKIGTKKWAHWKGEKKRERYWLSCGSNTLRSFVLKK